MLHACHCACRQLKALMRKFKAPLVKTQPLPAAKTQTPNLSMSFACHAHCPRLVLDSECVSECLRIDADLVVVTFRASAAASVSVFAFALARLLAVASFVSPFLFFVWLFVFLQWCFPCFPA